MKRLALTLVAALLAVQFAFAWGPPSILNLRLSNNQPLLVYLDGVNLGTNASQVRITDLFAGIHNLQVYTLQNTLYGQQYVSVFQGQILINQSRQVFATIDPYRGQLRIDHEAPVNRTYNPRWNTVPSVIRYNDVWDGHCQNTPVAPPQAVIPPVMDDVSFQQFIATLDNTAFETTRMSVLQSVASGRYFTTAQVIRILKEFSFESSRLEAAKMLYPRTVDHQNYFLVNNSFSFSSSIQNLSEFISSR